MLLVVASGALLLVAIVVAIAPRVWSMANAHSEDPVILPEFAPLAQRTYVYDAAGNEIAVYELENSQPIDFEDIPDDVIQAFLLIEDKEFFSRTPAREDLRPEHHGMGRELFAGFRHLVGAADKGASVFG